MKNNQSNQIDLMSSMDLKHWYKKWWAWLIIVIILIIGGAMVMNSNSSNHSANYKSSTSSSSQSRPSTIKSNPALHKTYHIGDTANYKGKHIKLDKVYYWGGNDIDTPDSGKQYVMAQVTVTNDSHSHWDLDSDDFYLNDNGSSDNWDEYLDNDDPHGGQDLDDGTLSEGATKSGFLYGQAKKGDKLKLQYEPDDLNSYKKITFDIN